MMLSHFLPPGKRISDGVFQFEQEAHISRFHASGGHLPVLSDHPSHECILPPTFIWLKQNTFFFFLFNYEVRQQKIERSMNDNTCTAELSAFDNFLTPYDFT